ncbi:uncharacterized protein L969DRAFT_616999 [Mixia osmundae IAM 14324]|uniref:Metallo-beta-lactamase domain-containing protein n=1 Tax=Mixia osmundae (strain CBS 9802 / IAM 14324 / JCM 22182 / KY 12970) TaxID=764103 RepID=G7E5Y3_MIXOS|nr:uncharacterized protein L969DRAFT_616999 [Mixia osmundae IAM 14324]KEI40606.1 hypothetical protein L969DRAFT_616999 [Mixia osmundae IAM 14324]GAA98243.1 hypothetical protein E5Q_04926 [Mixia osmundae IAM 14324]
MQLARLAEVEQLSPLVTRILGGNPSSFTLNGTNGYLIGSGRRKILIDTSDAGIPTYLSRLEHTLGTAGPNKSAAIIDHIIATHWHHDHVGALPEVLELLHKRNNGPVRLSKHRDEEHDEDILETLTDTPSDILAEHTLSPLREGDRIAIPDSDLHLRILSTPGHTQDSISLYLASHTKEPNVLFSADMILGQGTAVFENLTQYMASLRKTAAFIEEQNASQPTHIYPGHGQVIHDALGKLREYIQHRQDREDQVVDALLKLQVGAHEKAEELTKVIYPDLPDQLHFAATRGLLLVLAKLETEGKVSQETDSSQETAFALTDLGKNAAEARRAKM